MIVMILIVYDSISGNTEKMAKFIAEGASTKKRNVVMKKVTEVTDQDLIDAKVLVFGCPSYNRDLTLNMKKFFETTISKLKKKLKGKVGVAFGAYGWSGESIVLIKNNMKYLKMNILDLHQDFSGTPDDDYYITSLSDIKERSIRFGQELAKKSSHALKS
jgi:flavorubredoxin